MCIRDSFWTEGLFLQDVGGRYFNEALIEFRRERSHALLDVSVAGEQPGFLWHQIDRAISALEEFWPGIVREDEIFCPTRLKDTCRGRFEMEDVLLAQKEHDTLKCPKCRQIHEADTLMLGMSIIKRRPEYDPMRDDLQYLRQRDERPAPCSVLVLPVDSKTRWRDVKNWEVFGRRRLKALLLSEFSGDVVACLLYTSPSPRDRTRSRMPSSA